MYVDLIGPVGFHMYIILCSLFVVVITHWRIFQRYLVGPVLQPCGFVI